MAAIVRLDFTPPIEPDVVALHIYEGATKDGSFAEIDTVENVGTYPSYISYFTTPNASSTTNWFTIAWENIEGYLFPASEPIQGGTQTLVLVITDRVLQRDPDLDEAVVSQIAEWVIGKTKKTEDAFDPALTATLDELEGMTLLTLARSYLALSGPATSEDSYTAGLVSQKASTGRSLQSFQALVKWLVDEANKLLGWNWSVVMLLEDIDPTGLGTSSAINWDQSRLALTVNFE
jgi:hypothetical protein